MSADDPLVNPDQASSPRRSARAAAGGAVGAQEAPRLLLAPHRAQHRSQCKRLGGETLNPEPSSSSLLLPSLELSDTQSL